MKKVILILIFILSLVPFLHAQWVTNTNGTVTSTTNSVGIGTTTPVAGLSTEAGQNAAIAPLTEVPNGSAWIGGTGTNGGISMGQFSGNYGYIQSRHKLSGNGVFKLALNPLGGFVGIGTAAPASALHVLDVNPTLLTLERFNSAGGMNIQYKNNTYSIYAGLDVNGGFSVGTSANFNNSSVLTATTEGNVGIGTFTPQSALDVQHVGSGNTGAVISVQGFASAGAGGYLRLVKSRGTTVGSFVTTMTGDAFGTVDFMGVNSGNTTGYGARIIGYQDGTAGSTYLPGKLAFFLGNASNALSERMTITSSGQVGIGTSDPANDLHIAGAGTDLDGDNARHIVGGGLTIQANTGARSMSTGAQLEFAIPANTDGGNVWGQGRIITVAGNVNSNSASGKMIIGTRRTFDKLGSGSQWYYGNDLVIDGAGRIGIGTLTPREALSVNGNIRSKAIKVEIANWPDYVFDKDYQLPSLTAVKTYIDQNQHLPEMPSEREIAKDGLNLGEMNKLLVKKVEELTLYLIEIKEQIKEQSKTNETLAVRLKQQQAQIDELKAQRKSSIIH